MTIRKAIKMKTALAAAVALLGAYPLTAQEAPRAEATRAEAGERAVRGERPVRGERGERGRAVLALDRSIGRLMDRRYEMGLTDDQMGRLGDLRREAISALAPIREELTAVREGVRDGTLTRQQAGQRMDALRERTDELEALHNRFDEILEPEQRRMLRRGMAQRGRHGDRRGHGTARGDRRGSDRRG